MLAQLRSQAFLLAALAAPVVALAADEAGADKHGPIATTKQGVATAVTALVVFALVFGVLAVKVWPVITRALDERADKIKSEIAAAEQARREAREALDQYNKSLAQARAEAQQMLEQTKAQQLELAAALKAKADQELNAMRERAAKDIESAKRAAIGEIYGEATTLATTLASKILRREIRPDDQRELVEESLRQLQAANN